jgi:hypothetical protein
MDSEKTSHTVLPGTMTQSASGVTTPDLVANEKAQQHIEADSAEPISPEDDAPNVKEEYPTGMLLVPILVSTLFSVFLVSLDMTSSVLRFPRSRMSSRVWIWYLR